MSTLFKRQHFDLERSYSVRCGNRQLFLPRVAIINNNKKWATQKQEGDQINMADLSGSRKQKFTRTQEVYNLFKKIRSLQFFKTILFCASPCSKVFKNSGRNLQKNESQLTYNSQGTGIVVWTGINCIHKGWKIFTWKNIYWQSGLSANSMATGNRHVKKLSQFRPILGEGDRTIDNSVHTMT